ncbi:MAG: response regulator transcription factor [Chloroflexi bacterium]|jgi:two-component system response regulator DesR|nr:response regulator transcription factor [Chloroflexota bacterium]
MAGLLVEPVRVLLADDQEKVRSALKLFIEQEGGFCVVGEASTASDLLYHLMKTNPHVVLLDWELPGLPDSPQKLSPLRLVAPDIKIIALSGVPEARKSALAEGADGFVSKSEPPENVLRALYFAYDKV